MVRFTTFANILSGIGLTLLGVAAAFKYILASLGQTDLPYPFYAWAGGAIILVIVLILSIINTFTEIGGYVHPTDKLISNMVVFLTTIATVLMFGITNEGSVYAIYLFKMASMIVVAYVFLFIFVFFAPTITKGEEEGKIKEMTARFMLVSLMLGAVMAALQVGLDAVWAYFGGSYTYAAGTLGLVALVMVVLIVLFLERRYEPVGK